MARQRRDPKQPPHECDGDRELQHLFADHDSGVRTAGQKQCNRSSQPVLGRCKGRLADRWQATSRQWIRRPRSTSTEGATHKATRGQSSTCGEARAEQDLDHRSSALDHGNTLRGSQPRDRTPDSDGCDPDGAERQRPGLHRCIGWQAARERRDIHSGGNGDEHHRSSARATSRGTRCEPWCCPSRLSLVFCKGRDRASSPMVVAASTWSHGAKT